MTVFRMLLLFVVLFSSGSLYAEDAAKNEAEILLDMMGMEDAIEQSMEQMLLLQTQQNPALAPYQGVMMQFLTKHMSYQSLKPQLIALYAAAFTAAELRDIIAFYQTATGQKTLQKMPELMAHGAQLGAQRVQDNIQELQAMIQSESERLQERQTP